MTYADILRDLAAGCARNTYRFHDCPVSQWDQDSPRPTLQVHTTQPMPDCPWCGSVRVHAFKDGPDYGCTDCDRTFQEEDCTDD